MTVHLMLPNQVNSKLQSRPEVDASRAHLPFLDDWRILATVYMIAFHTAAFLESRQIALPGLLHVVVFKGFVGTSFFMLMSGFLIDRIYHGRLDGRGRVTFWLKRICRSYPAYLCVIMLGILQTYFLGQVDHPLGVRDLLDIGLNLLALNAWWPASVANISGAGWTLGTLYLFYLLYPFFQGVRRPLLVMAGLWLLTLIPPLWFMHIFPAGIQDGIISNPRLLISHAYEYLHQFPPIRIAEPLMGMLLSQFLRARSLASLPKGTQHLNWRLLSHFATLLLLLSLLIPLPTSFFILGHNGGWLPLLLLTSVPDTFCEG